MTQVPGTATLRPPLRSDDLGGHATFRIGPQGMVLTWGRPASLVTGWAAEEIIGQDFAVLRPPPSAAAHVSVQDHGEHPELITAAERGVHEVQCWLARRDGRRFWVNLVITSMRDPQGRLRGFTVAVVDLTDRLRADALLAVLDSTPQAILTVDEHGIVTFANRAGRRLFGYGEEMLAVPLERLLPAMVREHLPSNSPDGQPWHPPRMTGSGLELDAVRRDGSVFLAEVSLSSVQTPRGRTVTVAIRVADDREGPMDIWAEPVGPSTGDVFAASPVGRAEATLGSVVLRANPALERMLCYGPGELVGVHWAKFVHPSDRADLVGSPLPAAKRVDLAEGAAGYYEAERRLVRRDGRVLPALIATTVMRDPVGRPKNLVGIVLDNTDAGRARRQLLQLATRL
ncbi:PAS domain-containing protein [Spongisporangium articulatum]|uniref:PAS domain-containing protein n=1 Tax=Spongisporangium articulatum TaxID=3362603 RepID=A0ABW8AJX3_9ACTN